MRIRQHPGVIVGIKVAHYTGPEWDPVTRAVAAGRETNVPVMVDFGGHTPPLPLEDLLMKHLRPGDILTHTYAHVAGEYRSSTRAATSARMSGRRASAASSSMPATAEAAFSSGRPCPR